MKTARQYITAIIIVISLILSFISGAGFTFAAAATSTGSPVMDDLRQDVSFDPAAYPIKNDDYSLEVIQIAESTDGELLVYVYQPSGQAADLRASSINISRKKNNIVDEELDFKNYKLTYCNSSNTLFKYKVQDFEIEKSQTRYYNISNILRFNHKDLVAGNTQSEEKNRVGQLWTAETDEDGRINYFCLNSDVVEIKSKIVGFKRYPSGYHLLYDAACDGHFVAFSCAQDMDKLVAVNLSYMTTSYTYALQEGVFVKPKEELTVGDPVEHNTTINEGEIGENQVCFWNWGRHATWDRIEKIDDFLKDANNWNYTITREDGKAALQDCQWVLRFCETSYFYEDAYNDFGAHFKLEEYVHVTDVMILDLKFEYKGKVYKLGAVDNKQAEAPNDPLVAEKENDFWIYGLCICGGLLVVGVIIEVIRRRIKK